MEVSVMSFYGKWETWKIVYLPKKDIYDGTRGVAFVEAGDYGHAMQTFREQYSGQYVTVESCKKLFE
jgi:hypothetical protein